MKNVEQLQRIIELFLLINPQPSDQQFHEFAAGLGVDHEYLESISYAMLADSDEVETQAGVEFDDGGYGETDLSQEQEVLDGDYDPNTTTTDDLLLNDGSSDGEDAIRENQDSTYDDGVGPDDIGVDIEGDKTALIDDGVAPISLNAATRLLDRLFKTK